MSYKLAADIVTVIHSILIFFVFISIGVSIFNKKFRPIEASILLIVIVLWSLYSGCPLTYFESYLRELSGFPLPSLINEGFIPHYLDKWLGLSITGKQIVIYTYFVAGLFFLLSIDWFYEYFVKISKLRKFKSKLKKYF